MVVVSNAIRTTLSRSAKKKRSPTAHDMGGWTRLLLSSGAVVPVFFFFFFFFLCRARISEIRVAAAASFWRCTKFCVVVVGELALDRGISPPCYFQGHQLGDS